MIGSIHNECKANLLQDIEVGDKPHLFGWMYRKIENEKYGDFNLLAIFSLDLNKHGFRDYRVALLRHVQFSQLKKEKPIAALHDFLYNEVH